MTTFIVLAAVMAALAAAVVAVPLFRDRKSRLAGGLAAVCVAGAAAALYPLWSNWNWHAPAGAKAASPEALAMVAKLEQRLRDQPNDIEGWLLLGRSDLALEKLDDAIVAYDHALKLDAGNSKAALGLGEAMSLRAGGNITPTASQLFEQALARDPTNPEALLYGGFAAAERGDTAVARTRWEALKALHPPPQIEQLLDARIAELGQTGGPQPQPAAQTQATNAADSTGAEVTVNLKIADPLRTRLTRDSALFVFAREPGVAGPPLAVKRLTSAAIGTQVHLSAADSMMAGRALTAGQKIAITARVSFSGQPLPAAGDLYGELTYDVGQDGVRDLVIDRVAD